ncbi:MAG: addiction module toxin RelE [Gemmatimonadetes bacterium]|nr:addiction module toxin RelE [Gemmatimonadota bacterium]MYF17815.1 addiction module toxin RelE [Gemmatimonadota bacterium]
MEWIVEFHPAFEREFDDYPETVQDSILARAGLIELHGPQLGRPYADTLSGSRHANLKELRFDAGNGVWRVAFTFDPQRAAVLLAAGDKSGERESRFYRRLIAQAEGRFDDHLRRLKGNI